MYNTVLRIIFASIISLIGTMLGALIGVIFKKPSEKLFAIIMSFSGGVMLSLVIFELIPEAFTNWSIAGTYIFCFLGIGITFVFDSFFSVIANIETTYKLSIMAAIGLAIHNLPEGLIMGCSFLENSSLAIKMSFIIVIHDIPEGIAIIVPLMMKSVKPLKAMIFAFIAAVPTAVGLWLGIFLGNISKDILGICISFASGIMLYVVCFEMIPEASKINKGISTFAVIFGIILGVALINII